MNSITIAASILSADFTNLGQQIHLAEQAGVDWIHVDVMDGHFVPNITMGPFIVEWCRKISRLPIDVHLMIENPERHIDNFIAAGATSLSIHIESNPNVHRTIEAIRAAGTRPGIVINPGTSVTNLDAIVKYVDYVLVMTVDPGYSGQEYIPGSEKKVAEVRQIINQKNPSAFIQVDGGITAETIAPVYDAGARCFVAATSIFKFPSGIADGVAALRNVIG